MAGFTEAEGCFFIAWAKSPRCKSGIQIHLKFQITQHSRDTGLLKSFIGVLECGYYNKSSGYDHGIFAVTKFEDIINKIIPFFDGYPLIGAKRQDFLDFCKVAELMKGKAHLTPEGLEEIFRIKAGMNTGRDSGSS